MAGFALSVCFVHAGVGGRNAWVTFAGNATAGDFLVLAWTLKVAYGEPYGVFAITRGGREAGQGSVRACSGFLSVLFLVGSLVWDVRSSPVSTRSREGREKRA